VNGTKRRWRYAPVAGLLVALAFAAHPAPGMASPVLGTYVIDDFGSPAPRDYFLIDPLLINNDALLEHAFDDILGGERDILVEVIGEAGRDSAGGFIGYVSAHDVGQLHLVTAHYPGAILTLQYDGLDSGADAIADTLVDSRSLNADLTRGGVGDRIILEFTSSDGVQSLGLSVEVTAEHSGGGTLRWKGYMEDCDSACQMEIFYEDFVKTYDAGVQPEPFFDDIDSLTFVFNGNGNGSPTPDVDFRLDMISVAVPEPATVVSLGMAALLLVAFGWRKRRR